MLSLVDVSYSYRPEHPLLDSISFDVHEGEVLCIAGRSGAGKTTLLRLIAGLDRPHHGSIELAGLTLASRETCVPAEQRSVGFVFQDYQLFPHLNAQQNVSFGMRRQRGLIKRKRSLQLLERLGVADRAHALPHQLSGGEQQRVALARALAIEPRALLLDEPCRSLDEATAAAALDLIRAVVEEHSIPAIMVSHDAAMTGQISNRCLELPGATPPANSISA